MKTYMVIPTYWTAPSSSGKNDNAVYDHPTPLDKEGTILRILKSINILNDQDFVLLIIATITNEEYIEELEEKLKKIILEANISVKTILFTQKSLDKLKNAFLKGSELAKIVSLKSYPNIRNLCLFLPYILDAEVAILIDDDEVFEDSDFINKAKEFIGRRFYGTTVDGIAGYYLNEDNNYYDKVNMEPWMTYWDRFGGKREAFDKIIGKEPRLKKTPFAFGGAMVIHRNLMRIVPFDPKITRGEDTDYVINSKIFGFNFYLDNQLAIKHLPPPKKHHVWKRFREDIYRFLYDKSKIDMQYPSPNLHEIKPEDFDPYPGEFLKQDLDDKIFKTNILLALNYLTNNDVKACKETINNIYLAKYDAKPHYNTFEEYLSFQKKWRELLQKTKDFSPKLKNLIDEGTVVEADDFIMDKTHFLSQTMVNANYKFEDIPLFKPFTKKELRKIFMISEIILYKKGEYVFKCGGHDRSIYIVLSGKLNIIKQSDAMKEDIVVSTITEGDHFNETSIFFDKPHNVSILCTTPVYLLAIKKDKLLELINDNNDKLGSKLLWIISQKLSERLISTTEKYSESKTMDSDVSDFMEKDKED